MKILIVDDEEMQREMLQGFLKNKGYDVLTAPGGQEALKIFSKKPVDLVLVDHRMEDMNGDELLEKMKELSPLLRAIMITAFGSISTAVKVMQLGADDFLEKPVDLSLLLKKIEQIDRELAVNEEAEQVSDSLEREKTPIDIIGSSKSMQEVLSLSYRIAPTDWTALIRGETGTGKELVARMIHLLSPRKKAPFVEVNCAAIPENLFESELFGHEKGSFTGASSTRRGRFEQANEGTVFLDEVGELPLPLQAKLLRALQEKKISRVGSENEISVDIRILSATNRDLKKMVEKGTFREDLYFRLNVLEIIVPPLRERRTDVPELVEFFLSKHCGSRKMAVSSDAMNQLVKYDFPGNVRELEHLIQRLITLVRGKSIRLEDLPPEIREKRENSSKLSDRLAEVELQMLLHALEEHNWVQTRAAESLGISERVLRYKMGKAGIDKDKG